MESKLINPYSTNEDDQSPFLKKKLLEALR